MPPLERRPFKNTFQTHLSLVELKPTPSSVMTPLVRILFPLVFNTKL